MKLKLGLIQYYQVRRQVTINLYMGIKIQGNLRVLFYSFSLNIFRGLETGAYLRPSVLRLGLVLGGHQHIAEHTNSQTLTHSHSQRMEPI